MASGKKTFARRDALRSCPHSGDRAAAAGCPRALRAEQARSAERAFRVCPVPGDASEDLDIVRQAGEGVQVRDRDDVVAAKVEHHSAVRECRVVRDDIRSTLAASQRAGEAQCINARQCQARSP